MYQMHNVNCLVGVVKVFFLEIGLIERFLAQMMPMVPGIEIYPEAITCVIISLIIHDNCIFLKSTDFP